ncbi:MAG: hypothetical protein PHY28_08985 [Dehalococcoidales bacterium]|nr:hypothetical protein [Dehalococcoidales bacterium]
MLAAVPFRVPIAKLVAAQTAIQEKIATKGELISPRAKNLV